MVAITLLAYLVTGIFVFEMFRISLMRMMLILHSVKCVQESAVFKALPSLTIVVPAFNEEKAIERTIASLSRVNYPSDKLEIIVVNDGSKDRTEAVALSAILSRSMSNARVISQQNAGKANALNNALAVAKGDIFVCLDADSELRQDALIAAVHHFSDDSLAALSANVQITAGSGWLSLLQQLEYAVGHTYKRGTSAMGAEYIVGGIGSFFRTEVLRRVGGYDSDTKTEDIDLTLKLRARTDMRIAYAHDVVAYTQSVMSVSDLYAQRKRWQKGWFQCLWKWRELFFSTQKPAALSFFWLPFVVVQRAMYALEPLATVFLVLILVVYGDWYTVLLGYSVGTFLTAIAIAHEGNIKLSDKLRLIALSSFMWPLSYVLVTVEQCALWATVWSLRDKETSCAWTHVSRHGAPSLI